MSAMCAPVSGIAIAFVNPESKLGTSIIPNPRDTRKVGTPPSGWPYFELHNSQCFRFLHPSQAAATARKITIENAILDGAYRHVCGGCRRADFFFTPILVSNHGLK